MALLKTVRTTFDFPRPIGELQDMRLGAEDFGVELNAHINFCIEAMQGIADELGLVPQEN